MRLHKRQGFTLIELMVAMALTLFVMVILTQAFSLALDTFAGIKGIGDMQQNLRVATVLLRDDLKQDHFEGKRRLSDMTLSGQAGIVAEKPQAGFFAVGQGSPPNAANPAYTFEGAETGLLSSFRASDHSLHMTVKRRGNRAENFFTTSLQVPVGQEAVLGTFFNQSTAYNMTSAEYAVSTWAPVYVPNSTVAAYHSEWAEVMYFLVRTGSTEEPNNASSTIGTPTWSLMRAQFVMVPNGTSVSTLYPANSTLEFSTFAGMSCNPNPTNLQFFSPQDAANGQRVLPVNGAFNAARIGPSSTLVMPHVISFQVQIMPTTSNAFQDVPGGVYDTARINTPGYGNNFGLKAIQVTLRVWDTKTRQTRQVTIVQDM